MVWLAFVGSCFLLAMIPGAGTALILRQTLRAGRSSGVAALLGNEIGIFLWAIGRAGAVLGRPAVRRRLEQLSGTVLVALGVRVAMEAR
ncbi:hypothetical protein [Microbispora sp. NPDC046933]|uniref:hypothetical protein n=1 Tax=Microbispora sp. NPDC046933 TaxID=3155618 RepID=UPI0033C7AC36